MSLEKRNYNVKYIKKLLNQSGEEIVNLENILSEQKSFYRNLYSSRENNIDSSYQNFLCDDTLPRFHTLLKELFLTVFSTLSKMVCYQQINAEVLLL